MGLITGAGLDVTRGQTNLDSLFGWEKGGRPVGGAAIGSPQPFPTAFLTGQERVVQTRRVFPERRGN